MSPPVWHPVGSITAWETVPFSHVGFLSARQGRSRFPIIDGSYALIAVAAALDTAPEGSPVVLDVNVNGVSIYPTIAAQPTFEVGATLATVGAHTATTVTDGDYLTVDIDQVGDVVPGADLVVSVRLRRNP